MVMRGMLLRRRISGEEQKEAVCERECVCMCERVGVCVREWVYV